MGRGDDDNGGDHARDAGEKGEGERFEEELLEDLAGAGAESFEKADLAGSFGDRDEHDVHDAHAADAEGHGANDAEDDLEGDRELVDGGGVFDGIPGAEGLLIAGIEVVTLGEHGADGLNGFDVEVGAGGLEDDGVGIALLGEVAHEREGKEGVFVVRPLLEESWILLRRTPMTSKTWPSISTVSPTGGYPLKSLEAAWGPKMTTLRWSVKSEGSK